MFAKEIIAIPATTQDVTHSFGRTSLPVIIAKRQWNGIR